MLSSTILLSKPYCVVLSNSASVLLVVVQAPQTKISGLAGHLQVPFALCTPAKHFGGWRGEGPQGLFSG